MAVQRGKQPTYLMMELDYINKGGVVITMESYIKEALEEFPEEEWTPASSPVSGHLFKVNDNGKPLEEKRVLLFHILMAKLIFVRKQECPYIQTTISFLNTRVRIPDEDDWKKICCLVKYLFGTMEDIALHLNADDLKVMHWWVDLSYGTHSDLKDHTGATIFIKKGCVTSISKKQNVNTTSSTISEIIGVQKSSPQVLWNFFSPEPGVPYKRSDLLSGW